MPKTLNQTKKPTNEAEHSGPSLRGPQTVSAHLKPGLVSPFDGRFRGRTLECAIPKPHLSPFSNKGIATSNKGITATRASLPSLRTYFLNVCDAGGEGELNPLALIDTNPLARIQWFHGDTNGDTHVHTVHAFPNSGLFI